MKSRLRVALICAFVAAAMLLCALPAGAETPNIKRLADEIVAGRLAAAGETSVQAFIDGALTDGAGESSEWYAIALAAADSVQDFSRYTAALASYITEKPSAADGKCATALLACGAWTDAADAALVVNADSGIMSLVFALHLQNNGRRGGDLTSEELVKLLLERRLADGGWALSGGVSDVDVTAMVLQALAPHSSSAEKTSAEKTAEEKTAKEKTAKEKTAKEKTTEEKTADMKNAVDGALALLSERQLDSGEYLSFGAPNPESAAQVIIALSALGLDPLADEGFIKNGNTLLDGMLLYRLADGSFSHTVGGASNGNSTVQALCALTALERFYDGDGSFYIFDRAENPQILTAGSSTPDDKDNGAGEPCGYKLPTVIIILAAAALGCLLIFILKKRNYKNYLVIMLAAALTVTAVLATDIRTRDSYYGDAEPKGETVGAVTLTIRCDSVLGMSDSTHIPDDGVILETTSFDIAAGETVYDILTEAARKYSIQLENDGGDGATAYIAGIGYIYERDFGDMSGWHYYVNGESPSVGCGSFTLTDGDCVEWVYLLKY